MFNVVRFIAAGEALDVGQNKEIEVSDKKQAEKAVHPFFGKRRCKAVEQSSSQSNSSEAGCAPCVTTVVGFVLFTSDGRQQSHGW